MESFEGETRYAEYDEFSLEDEASSYTLYVAGFLNSSTVGTCVAIPSFSSAMCALSCRFRFAPLARPDHLTSMVGVKCVSGRQLLFPRLSRQTEAKWGYTDVWESWEIFIWEAG